MTGALRRFMGFQQTEIKKCTNVTVNAIAGVAVVTAYQLGAYAIAYLPSIFSGWTAANESKDAIQEFGHVTSIGSTETTLLQWNS